jgi:phasin family protein
MPALGGRDAKRHRKSSRPDEAERSGREITQRVNYWEKYMFADDVKVPAATQAVLAAQLDAATALANTSLSGIERLTELNLSVAKAMLGEFTETATQLVWARDPQEFFSVASARTQSRAERIANYGRELVGIVSGTQAELGEVAQSHFADANQKVVSLVEEIGKNPPAGSENAMEMLKSVMSNAQTGYERFAESGRQAAQLAKENLDTVARQMRREPPQPGERKH